MFITFLSLFIISIIFYDAFLSNKYSFDLFSFTIMKEKVYIKDNKEITLLGMIHIANKSFYKDIKKDFENFKGITLIEGILDKNKLLPKGKLYEKVAERTSYVVQEKKIFPNEINADIDVSELTPESLKKVIRLKKILRGSTKEKFKWDKEFKNEIIGMRNKVLMSHIDNQLIEKDKILVPWGAKHLPEIEKHLKKNGFKLKKLKFRPSLNYFHWFYTTQKALKELRSE